MAAVLTATPLDFGHI